jgi:hypothetical protein
MRKKNSQSLKFHPPTPSKMRETSLPQYLRFLARAPTAGAKDEEGDDEEEQ